MVASTDGRPRVVAGLRLLHVVGRGGEGEVWEVRDERGRRRALKLIRPDALVEPGQVEDRGRHLVRIDHPALVAVHRCGVLAGGSLDGWGFVEMDLIEGASLHGAVGDRTLLERLEPLAEGLDLLHAGHWSDGLPLVHRDVKPSNIIARPDGDVVLVDPSTLRGVDATVLTRIGTPLFAAPEVVTGRLGPPADVYSFAATVVAVVTGARGDGLGDLLDDPSRLDLPDGVRRALSPWPQDRPTSCRAVLSGAASEPIALVTDDGWHPPVRGGGDHVDPLPPAPLAAAAAGPGAVWDHEAAAGLADDGDRDADAWDAEAWDGEGWDGEGWDGERGDEQRWDDDAWAGAGSRDTGWDGPDEAPRDRTLVDLDPVADPAWGGVPPGAPAPLATPGATAAREVGEAHAGQDGQAGWAGQVPVAPAGWGWSPRRAWPWLGALAAALVAALVGLAPRGIGLPEWQPLAVAGGVHVAAHLLAGRRLLPAVVAAPGAWGYLLADRVAPPGAVRTWTAATVTGGLTASALGLLRLAVPIDLLARASEQLAATSPDVASLAVVVGGVVAALATVAAGSGVGLRLALLPAWLFGVVVFLAAAVVGFVPALLVFRPLAPLRLAGAALASSAALVGGGRGRGRAGYGAPPRP